MCKRLVVIATARIQSSAALCLRGVVSASGQKQPPRHVEDLRALESAFLGP